jgi:hypothetical protein
LRNYLRENGIQSKVANDVPQRLAAARAGLGTFGKNNFFYASRTARQSSWVVAVAILTDGEFAPDEPSISGYLSPIGAATLALLPALPRYIGSPIKLIRSAASPI